MRAEVLSTEGGIVVIKVSNQYLQTIDECGKDVDISISKHRKKRSLNANAYLWALCEEIAKCIRSTKEDVYRQAIKDVGVFKVYQTLDDTLKIAWESLGIGWVVEEMDDHTRCYYGSSVYNTEQMSRLVDSIVEEAKELGIETATPQEIERLKDTWTPVLLTRKKNASDVEDKG